MITSKIRRTAPYGAMFMISQAEIEVKTDKKKTETKVVDLVSFSGQVDSHGVPLVLPIDQFSGKSFCLNPQGFPMNDIMAYESAQSNSFAETVLRRINVLHPESIDQNLTPEEMFDSVVPANWSSPAEFVQAQKNFASKWYARQQAKKSVEPESDPNTIKFENPNPPEE